MKIISVLPEQSLQIVIWIRQMLAEMENYGGLQATEENSFWDAFSQTMAREIAEKTTSYWFAILEERPVGMVGATIPISTVFLARTLHIQAIYILPEYRQRGFAKLLLEHSLQWGREMGCQSCDLHVLSKNPAQKLYQRLGFQTVEWKMEKLL